jgi:putative flippase GtrA
MQGAATTSLREMPIKAARLSILAFQVGTYLWMALVYFFFFPAAHLHPNKPAYWLTMQVGMVLGFLTSYPMNRLLIRMRWKEGMG